MQLCRITDRNMLAAGTDSTLAVDRVVDGKGLAASLRPARRGHPRSPACPRSARRLGRGRTPAHRRRTRLGRLEVRIAKASGVRAVATIAATLITGPPSGTRTGQRVDGQERGARRAIADVRNASTWPSRLAHLRDPRLGRARHSLGGDHPFHRRVALPTGCGLRLGQAPFGGDSQVTQDTLAATRSSRQQALRRLLGRRVVHSRMG